MLKHLPNALTLLRLILAPTVALAMWRAYMMPVEAAAFRPGDFGEAMVAAQVWAVAAALLFVVAALTDLFDGIAARALKVDSKFGRMLDPIADKVLVGLPLIAISAIAVRTGWPMKLLIAGAATVIIGRDILITVIRLNSPDSEGLRVSQLAKWKTTAELLAIGAPLVLAATPALESLIGVGDGFASGPAIEMLWAVLLAIAAALSAFTGYRYLAAK